MPTPSPTVWTVPAPSWPSTAGSAMVASPFWKCRSLRQTPAAPILISTSPRLGGSSSTLSTAYGLLTSYSTAAVTRMGPVLPVSVRRSLAEIGAGGKRCINPTTLTGREAADTILAMASYETRTRRFTRAEYERLIELGVFQPEEKIELIGGELMVAEPKGAPHYTAVVKTARALEA